MQTISKKHMRQWLLPGLLGLILCAQVPNTYAAIIKTGFSPEGAALQLVLKTIETTQQEIRLMGYSFTSPKVAWVLVRIEHRGIDVGVVLDQKTNVGRNDNTSKAVMNLLVGTGIPVRTVSAHKTLHDKVIVVNGHSTQTGSSNFSRAADRSSSENMLVVWDDPVLARSYLSHQISRWVRGTDWKQTY